MKRSQKKRQFRESPEPIDNLSDSQAELLCTVVASQGEEDSFVKVSFADDDGKRKAASDELVSWGLIDFNADGLVRVTQAGLDKLSAEGLYDEDTRQLTDAGNQHISQAGIPGSSSADEDPFATESVKPKVRFLEFAKMHTIKQGRS